MPWVSRGKRGGEVTKKRTPKVFSQRVAECPSSRGGRVSPPNPGTWHSPRIPMPRTKYNPQWLRKRASTQGTTSSFPLPPPCVTQYDLGHSPRTARQNGSSPKYLNNSNTSNTTQISPICQYQRGFAKCPTHLDFPMPVYYSSERY